MSIPSTPAVRIVVCLSCATFSPARRTHDGVLYYCVICFAGFEVSGQEFKDQHQSYYQHIGEKNELAHQRYGL